MNSNKMRSAADDAAIEAKIETERRIRVAEGWSDAQLQEHLNGYREELQYQHGWPACERCGTPDPSVVQSSLSGHGGEWLCVFCAEDVSEQISDSNNNW